MTKRPGVPGRFRARKGPPAGEPDEGAPSFPAKVFSVVRGIAPGEVRPYLWVAKEAGHPGAARAVGRALRGCPTDVPWHRVVGRFGDARCPGRPELQVQRLLDEGTGWQRTLACGRRKQVVLEDAGRAVYCYPSCRQLGRPGKGFESAAAAETSGLRPCPACRPV